VFLAGRCICERLLDDWVHCTPDIDCPPCDPVDTNKLCFFKDIRQIKATLNAVQLLRFRRLASPSKHLPPVNIHMYGHWSLSYIVISHLDICACDSSHEISKSQ